MIWRQLVTQSTVPSNSQQIQLLDEAEFNIRAQPCSECTEAVPRHEDATIRRAVFEQFSSLLQLMIP